MRHAYLVLPAILLAVAAQAGSTTELRCGRESPVGEGDSHVGIGHIPVKVTSSGLVITFHYLAYKGRKDREYIYRILSAGDHSLSLVRVDSLGQDKVENTAKLSFDRVLA